MRVVAVLSLCMRFSPMLKVMVGFSKGKRGASAPKVASAFANALRTAMADKGFKFQVELQSSNIKPALLHFMH
jgi:hypothetical protein